MNVRKAVILAGGYGTRLSEETGLRPKPLVEIGGRPILWHIMKTYYHYGITEFIICLGYKGYMIKEYFSNYFLHMSDVTFDFNDNSTTIHDRRSERWKVTLVDTGQDTMTGGRLKRIAPYVGDETFCMTYGDGVGDIDVGKLIQHHVDRRRDATVTLVRPPGRFGAADLSGDTVHGFKEKPTGGSGWINAGYFVLSPSVFDLIEGDATVWEREPLERLAAKAQLSGYKHEGFWEPMDTLRDKNNLEDLWARGSAPWRVWG
ncbi:glucose-1-phosphate cytidylyltransferase [Microvirga sp. HBU67558]|uniref:glucose-1-phosphate cytidylyltransferase n=1 Tax=Microvirga TaxID=186650 RepID=UPI001B3911F8|nr:MULTISPECIES: glucose-1-phosphate cytidylyltransferase [unclassified Microvirga]MBQ0823541.1 glucose-1-phosphate cytidylyltransferase [Microvirga sp. HBU67558]